MDPYRPEPPALRTPAFLAAAREADRLMQLPAIRDPDGIPRRLQRRAFQRMHQVAGWRLKYLRENVSRATLSHLRAMRER